MIFSMGDHIKQIIAGTKTQTRRKSGWYQVGKTYAIQSGRTKPGIPEGRILIISKRTEYQPNVVSGEDALAEGGYTPGKFEELYRGMNWGWDVRYAYTFKFVATEEARR